MKILTYTSLYPNSANPNHGVFVAQRMAHLARRPGISVHVVAPVPFCPAWARIPEWQQFRCIPAQETINGVTVYHPRYLLVPKISMPLHGVAMYLGSIRLARRLHWEIGFDCIDGHYVYPDGFAAVMLGRALGIPTFVSARGTDINVFPSFTSIRPMIRWTLRHAAGGIAVSTPLRDKMVSLGLLPEKARVIGNGVDASRFVPLDRAECRKRLEIRAEKVIVSVGSLIESKGHQLALAALPEVLSQHASLKLYIIGSGPIRERLQRLAVTNGIAANVHLVGRVPNEELKYWYSAADVTCLFSEREGWPNVLLESIACGTPVVATSVGGIPEVLASDDVGLMVEGKMECAAAGLRRGLTHGWDREALRRFAERRTWDSVAAELEAYFLPMLRSRAELTTV